MCAWVWLQCGPEPPLELSFRASQEHLSESLTSQWQQVARSVNSVKQGVVLLRTLCGLAVQVGRSQSN